MQYSVFGWTLLSLLVLVLSVWAVSVRIKDASIVDIFWGIGFVVIVWAARLASGGEWNARRSLVVAATTLWGLRLAAYLAWRNLGKGEDFRYRAMRKKFGDKFWLVSLRTVYLTQGVLMWVVSLPIQVAVMRFSRDSINGLLIIGVAVWLIGFAFESIGDVQLAKFKANPANKGLVMDRGLWAWTRHPNYFGDATVWWGLFLMAVSIPQNAWTIVGPIIMSVLLRKYSGVPMLERTMSKRRPGYDEYVKRTNAFLPRPPKRTS